MKRFSTLVLLVILFTTLASAANYKVKGLVTDSIGEPEPFATVRVYPSSDTTRIAAMGVTSEKGVFSLAIKSQGKYNLSILSVGRAPSRHHFEITGSAPTADLGTIVVRNDDKLLGEVTVTATRPLVTKDIDRIGYDVQADEDSKTSTLDEMLRRVPLVSVDADGTIQVKGSSDFKIYKNGRPNNSFTKNAKEIFKAIPASMIKKIEVITDPGAREDAEGVGAILNIVTLENTVVKGVMGTASLNYDTRSNIPAPMFWGSTQIDKLTMSLYAGVNFISKRQGKNRNLQEGVFDESGNVQRDESWSRNSGYASWFGLDGSYELDSLNLFTAEVGGYVYDIKGNSYGQTSLTAPDGTPRYRYNSQTVSDPTRYFDINGSFNYQHSTRRPGENLTLSYQISTTNQTNKSESVYSDEVNMPVPYTGILSDFRLDFIEHTFQFDWARPFANIHTINLGVKYIYRDNHSKTKQNYLNYIDEPELDFKHLTHVAAAYADYRVKLGRFNMRAGVRYEFSRMSAEYADDKHQSFASNFNDIVPNAAVSYSINNFNTLKISFGTRINRPGISYLNPAVSETPTATSQGNPDLGSARNTSLTLNYNLIGQKVNMDFSTGYSFTNNDIVQVQNVVDDHFYSGYANAGHNKSFFAGMFIQWTAGKKTNVMLNANANYNHYANPSLGISNSGWGGHAFLRLTQRLPWKLQGHVMMSTWTGNVNGLYGSFRPVGISYFDYGLSLQRSFLKEDRLTVRLSTWNPIYASKNRFKTTTCNLPYRSVSRTWQDTPLRIGIGISYRFGSLNAQVKKTVKTIENDDLTGRIASGGGDSGGSAKEQ